MQKINHQKFKQLLKIAVVSALKAGEEILNVYQISDFNVEFKSDHSPLTNADKKSHAIISHDLASTNIPILSEEGKEIAYSERANWRELWVIDPLDGTKEFIKRNGDFTVNIALVIDEKPVIGVVYIPVEDVLYFSLTSLGAFKLVKALEYKNAISEDIEPFLVNPIKYSNKLLSNNPRVVASLSHFNSDTERFISQLSDKYGEVKLLSRGSSLKFCLLADGLADIYPRFAPTMEWDTAAGHAIVETCGFKVTLTDGCNALIYNKENLLNPWFLVQATHSNLHA